MGYKRGIWTLLTNFALGAADPHHTRVKLSCDANILKRHLLSHLYLTLGPCRRYNNSLLCDGYLPAN